MHIKQLQVIAQAVGDHQAISDNSHETHPRPKRPCLTASAAPSVATYSDGQPIGGATEKGGMKIPVQTTMPSTIRSVQSPSHPITVNFIEKETATGDIWLFSLGIGCDVSHSLVEGMARGFAQILSDEKEGIEGQVVRMLRELSSLLLDQDKQGVSQRRRRFSSMYMRITMQPAQTPNT
jgi:hypothetical protein